MDDSCESASDCSTCIRGEVCVEVLVRGEDLASLGGDNCTFVADVDRTVEVPVNEVDDSFAGEMCKGHVVKDDSVVLGGVEVAKVVDVGDHKWRLELMDRPLRFSGVRGAVDEEYSKVSWRVKSPDCIGERVLELLSAGLIVSDCSDVGHCVDFDSCDFARFPE